MSQKVDLYNSSYQNYQADVYTQVRLETYGEDFGQTSWVTTQESREIPQILGLNPSKSVLEIGCGSGRYGLHVVESVGCHLLGLDVNESGVANANQLAEASGLADRARFERCDATKELPFPDATFDAMFSNDVLCHLAGRENVLREVFRVLRRGGRMLFSDALVIGGVLSSEEIALRSSIGYYVYSPPGENARLMERAGFQQIEVRDTTSSASLISQRWHAAREKRKNELTSLEGERNFEGLQRFLDCVHKLTSSRRLLRHLCVATKV